MSRILLLLLLWPATGLAFSSGGHRVISEIAWQQLDGATRAHYVDLLKHHSRFEDLTKIMPDSVRNGTDEMKDHWIFLEASVWPDTVRGLKGAERAKYHRSTWHYVNFPTYNHTDCFSLEEYDLSKLNRSTEFEGGFRDEGGFNIVQAVKANLAGLRDETRSKAERAVHLCWVMHLVGDAHQPLHSTAMFCELFPKGDRGGNLINTDKGRNLHSLWDRLLPYETTLGRVQSVTKKLVDEAQHVTPRFRKSPPEDWIEESWDYAKQFAYTRDVRAAIRAAEESGEDAVKASISEEYLRAAGQLARRRAVTAGARLAHNLGVRIVARGEDSKSADLHAGIRDLGWLRGIFSSSNDSLFKIDNLVCRSFGKDVLRIDYVVRDDSDSPCQFSVSERLAWNAKAKAIRSEYTVKNSGEASGGLGYEAVDFEGAGWYLIKPHESEPSKWSGQGEFTSPGRGTRAIRVEFKRASHTEFSLHSSTVDKWFKFERYTP